MASYDHKKIEKKWQEIWEKEGAFRADDNSPKEKLYVLDMFPYPSGAGLHVGHVEGYTATDIYSRFKRTRGFNVLHPMGWDAFGLPAENYAIKTGIAPAKTTADAINEFRAQIKALGLSYDWEREIGTHTPEYYTWTQWFFLFLYNNGLAEKRMAKVNWCPKDQTVLANEQTVSETGEKGVCFRCGTKVVQKDLEQWFFKITNYADALNDDLDQIDWPESTKIAQRNWIGRSEGAEIEFPVTLAPPKGDFVFASNNQGKLKRMQMLFKAAGLNITLKTPKDVDVEDFDVVEDGKTLAENAEKKARVLAEKTNLPVFADDSGFFIDGTKIDPVTVKRNALEGLDEKSLSIEEIAEKMAAYYQNIATQRGGRVDAEWHNGLCLVTSEKTVLHAETIRPVILTSESRGKVDPYLPLRGLYISKATGKYVLEQNEEEDLVELQPITDGIKKLLTPAIKVFTTRVDTIFGATYMVLAPEHPIIEKLLEKVENKKEVEQYIEKAKNKTDLERQEETKEKTGVELKGIKAINPANKEEIPIYVADYVLWGYGTGAIMAVPAHDERDGEFAKKFNIPVRQVVAPVHTRTTGTDAVRADAKWVDREAVMCVVKHWEKDEYLILQWKDHPEVKTFIAGGTEDDEDPAAAGAREIIEETGYTHPRFVRQVGGINYSEFYHQIKNVNRRARFTYLYFELADGEKQEASAEDQKNHDVLWKPKSEVLGFVSNLEKDLVWSNFLKETPYVGTGRLINSAQFDGLESEEAKKKITEAVGGKMVKTYRLRDWLISRQRYWGAPIPVVYDPEGKPHPIPEEHLPWLLPTDVDYLPHGTSPLATSKELLERTEKIFGKGWKPDVDTMDTFVCSSFYYFRFADPKNEREFASKEMIKKWLPVDLYVGGAEHTVLHLLYSRFITKALKTHAYIDFNEPFLKLRHQGLIGGEDGRKMSKSFGNVVNPMDVTEKYGADTLRLYEMFMGPLETAKPWSSKNILGVRRFLEKVWKVGTSGSVFASTGSATDTAYGLDTLLNQTTKKVTDDIENLKMNTAVSSLMILLNKFEEEKTVSKNAYKTFLQLLYPLAPHITSELWEMFGETISITETPWPTADESKIAAAKITIAIQVNGKVRGTLHLAPGVGEEEALALARVDQNVKKWLALGKETKAVYVAGKIISFVVV